MVLAKGYGLASLEDGRPITPRTTFDLGSAAKPFTALATLMLVEQGKLALDDDVRRYLPELPDYGTPIRIRDLLQHTSGLRDFGTLGLLIGRDITTMREFLSRMASQRVNFTPGTRHEYSHSDFHFLALIIERVTGEPFGAYLERESAPAARDDREPGARRARRGGAGAGPRTREVSRRLRCEIPRRGPDRRIGPLHLGRGPPLLGSRARGGGSGSRRWSRVC